MNSAPTSNLVKLQPVTHILIVDDEIENIRLLELLLRAEGYATASAANGEQALAAIAESAPDLVLLDVTRLALSLSKPSVCRAGTFRSRVGSSRHRGSVAKSGC